MAVVRRAAVPDVDTYLDNEEDDVTSTPVPPQRGNVRKAAVPEPEVEEEDPDEQASRSSAIQAGWGSAKKAMKSGAGFLPEFKFTEDEQLVKFQGDAPIAVYRQHWLNEVTEGKRSYICLGDECPLCNILGHKPDTKIAFSVVNVSSEDPEVQMLVVGTRLATTLETYNNDSKVGPLDKHYWSLKRTGKKTSTQYFANVVKARDLAEDWSLDPEEIQRQIDALKPLSDKDVRLDKKDVMEEVARDLMG